MVSDKSQIVLGCLLAFVVILSLNFTAAAIEIVSPANYTNASGRIMINFTYTNVTDIRDPLIANTTFYFNNVAVPVNNFTCLVNSCNVTLNTSDIADIVGRNLSVILGNESTLKPADANASFILIDNTKPVVFSGNISNPVTETNYSRNMTINVTVVDTTAGIRAVIFNITNSSGHQNGTFAGVREGTTNQYSFSINTSHFTEGLYNVTIKANDTSLGGNLNDSASVIRFRFDNTKPVVFPGNISNPVIETNYSRNMTINVTVVDTLAGVGSVMFNITNATSIQNATYLGVREGTTNQYSFSINTSHFPDGIYNVTVFANDTTLGGDGNLNNSASVMTFRFDNTRPVVFPGNISNPVIETNYSRNMTINVTVVDTTAGIRAVIFNITNSSGHQNGTFAGVREGTTNQYSFSINTSHFTEGLYNVTIKANDTTLGGDGNLNDSASVIRFRFDNTKPVVFPQNITAPLFVGNHSQNLKLNVTVFDALSSIRGVMFNITNSTGVQNSTYIATREGATDRYSVIINTSHFPTGLYNVTIFANDTTEGVGGNLNNSAISYEVRFDNVQPVLTLTCTPNPLVQQATLTCSCGVTDALSGVNGSRTSFTTNPSTSNTGVYSTECTSADLAGNAKTELLSYTVTSSGGSGGSSGGGSSSTTTTASATKTTTLAKIAPETPGIVKNLGEKFGMKEISISVNSATTNVKVTVNAYDSRPGSVSTKDGKVLKYLEITQQNIGSMKNAVLMLQIPKIWANSKGLTTSDIAAFKFKNGAWVELPTVFKSEDIGSYYFEATSDSFSFFVIGEKVKVVEQPEAVNNSPEVEETNEEVVDLAPTEEKSSVSFATIAWILLLVIVMAVIVVIVYKKRH